MKIEWLGYVLLPIAIVGIFGGMGMASDGKTWGYGGVALGLVFAGLSYRLMTPPKRPA